MSVQWGIPDRICSLTLSFSHFDPKATSLVLPFWRAAGIARAIRDYFRSLFLECSTPRARTYAI
jgi:hypothetical protein